MELDDFPDELLLKIFYTIQFSSFTDVSHLTLVCQKWRRLMWTKEFLQNVFSFKKQSRYILYRPLMNKDIQQNFLEYDSRLKLSYLTIDGDLASLKQDIQNCPLVNTSISTWCRTLQYINLWDGTIFLLWHFNLGYLGLYRDSDANRTALVKCTYTQEHRLQTTCPTQVNQWYHVVIVIKENETLDLYINGDRIGSWPLSEEFNKKGVSVAPYSSLWFASHCGALKWHGSLFDFCLWKRCLRPYEIKEMARERIPIEKIDFLSHVNL